MQIENRIIGMKEKPFIIAEAGINHNGNINIAFKMIEVAKKIGFEAIKFQTFKATEINIDTMQTYTYKSQNKIIKESMLEMFQRYEFSKDDWYKIKQKCDDEKIMFLSTPQNYSDLQLLMNIGIPAIKVGSDDFTNIPLLKEYRKAKLPMLLSCGMANFAEIYQSLEAVQAFENNDIALLLCTSEYPTPNADVNLLKLETLKKLFKELILGFSDHTQGVLAAAMSTCFGACIFEKHFTLDNNMEGPDHWFSENPESLKAWYNAILDAWEMLGNPILKPTEKEKEMRILARRSIYVIKDIYIGESITEEHIGLFRPGNGIEAIFWDDVVGCKALCNMKRGHKMKWGDFND